MKKSLLLLMALAGPAWAGEVKSSKAPIPPPEEPNLWNWFIGGSAGYLVDFDEPMYTAHVGVDTPYKVGPFDTAIYLEVGYTKKDESSLIPDTFQTIPGATAALDASLEIIPLTLNFKLERQLTDSLNFYFGAGIGVAFTSFDADINYTFAPDVHVSEDDTVFAAQVFTGLIYNINPHFELFGGARWIYIDASDHAPVPGTSDLDFNSDVLIELGARYTF